MAGDKARNASDREGNSILRVRKCYVELLSRTLMAIIPLKLEEISFVGGRVYTLRELLLFDKLIHLCAASDLE